MTTYDGDVVLPRRHGPAFGHAPALPRRGEGTGIARAAHEVDRGSTWDWDSRSYAGRVRRACLRLLPRRHSAVTGVWISVVLLVAGVVLVLLVAMRS